VGAQYSNARILATAVCPALPGEPFFLQLLCGTAPFKRFRAPSSPVSKRAAGNSATAAGQAKARMPRELPANLIIKKNVKTNFPKSFFQKNAQAFNKRVNCNEFVSTVRSNTPNFTPAKTLSAATTKGATAETKSRFKKFHPAVLNRRFALPWQSL
jgi:hypothetical protein